MSWNNLNAAEKFGIGLLDALKGVPFVGEYTDEAVGLFDKQAEQTLRRNLAAYEAVHPYLSTGSQIATGIASTLLGAGALARAGGLGARALQALGTESGLLGAIGLGATEGAVSGYGAGETPEERARGAVAGAAIGGGLSGAAGAIGGRLGHVRFGRGVAPEMAAGAERAGRQSAKGGAEQAAEQAVRQTTKQAARQAAKEGVPRIQITPQELEQEFLKVLDERAKLGKEKPYLMPNGLVFSENWPVIDRMKLLPVLATQAYARLLQRKGIDVPGHYDIHGIWRPNTGQDDAALRVGWKLLMGDEKNIDQVLFDEAVNAKGITLDTLYNSGATGMVLPTDPASKARRALEQGYTEDAYHGTARSFNYPDESELGSNTGAESAQLGLFSASNLDVADKYAMSAIDSNENKMMEDVYHQAFDEFVQARDELGNYTHEFTDTVAGALEKRGIKPDNLEQYLIRGLYEKLNIVSDKIGVTPYKGDETKVSHAVMDLRDLVSEYLKYGLPEGTLTDDQVKEITDEVMSEISDTDFMDGLRELYAIKADEDEFLSKGFQPVNGPDPRRNRMVPGQVYELRAPEAAAERFDINPLKAEIIPLKVRTTDMHVMEKLRGKSWADVRGEYSNLLHGAIDKHEPEVIKIPQFTDPAPEADHYLAVDMSAYRRPNAYFDPRLKKLAHLMAGIGAIAPSAGLFVTMTGNRGDQQ